MHTAQMLAEADRTAREAKAREQTIKRQAMEWKKGLRNERAAKLANKVTDGSLLLACLRFYSSLPAGEWVPASLIHERTKATTRIVKSHLTAARRILQVTQRDYHAQIRLPLNWAERLSNVGIQFDYHADFLALNADLKLDNDMHIFAAERPWLLREVQAFLRSGCQPTPRVKTPAAKPKKPWWAKAKGEQSNHSSLHEALAAKPVAELDDDPSNDDQEEEEDDTPSEQAWSRSEWLKERIAAFLADKSR
jgi:hypothetical protein